MPDVYRTGFLRRDSDIGPLVVSGLAPPPASPTVRDSSAAGTLTNSLVIPVPELTVDDDLLIAVLATRGSGNTVGTPAGWALSGTQARSGAGHLYAFRRTAAAEPADHTFTAVGASTHVGAMLSITGQNVATPIDVSFIGATGAASTAHPCPDITPLTPGTLLVHGACTASASDLTGDRYSWLIDEEVEALQNSGAGTGTGILSLATQPEAGTGLVTGPVATGISGTWATFSLAVAPA